MNGTFFQSVYAVVAQIPYGCVMTYGDIARAIGFPGRARYVGFAMRSCPEGLPWHRVVMADGTVTGGEWAPVRRMLLEQEGVPFRSDGRIDLQTCRCGNPTVKCCNGADSVVQYHEMQTKERTL